jgi:acyl-homoserine-lactone acylase
MNDRGDRADGRSAIFPTPSLFASRRLVAVHSSKILPEDCDVRSIRLTSILVPLVLAACAPGVGPRPEPGPAIERSEILWDTWGVPHVYGRTVEDVAYGYGWAQAQLHGDAILRLYGLARGRGAEYWGERFAASDRTMRQMGIPAAGREGYEAQDPEFRGWLDAFAEGLNPDPAVHKANTAWKL